jgi:hypothetical protein
MRSQYQSAANNSGKFFEQRNKKRPGISRNTWMNARRLSRSLPMSIHPARDFLLAWLFLLVCLPLQAQNPLVSSYLQQRIQETPHDWQDVYIVLHQQADLKGLAGTLIRSRQANSSPIPQIIPHLQTLARTTQQPILSWLSQHPQWVNPQSINAFWIQNLIMARVRPEAINFLSQRGDIAKIIWAAPAVADALSPAPLDLQQGGGHEPGHDAMQAPALWKLGYTGYGRKVYVIDSGVAWEHPALQRSFWGNFVPVEQAWYHPNGNAFPEACDLHGTHVTGIITALDPLTSDTVGVAFNANWMAAPAVGAVNANCNVPIVSVVSALQWALDPDGNPNTVDDVPDVINNSWAVPSPGPGEECNSVFSGIFDVLELAGIAVVFSAGNAGPGSATITSPKNIVNSPVNTFCVGNVNGHNPSYPIHNLSSHGPALCGDSTQNQIKPEVVAPGVGVRSTAPGGGYANFTGTSMSAAQVSGSLLLLKEAFPQLTGTELKYALYETALDLGTPGEDNVYGQGLIQLKAAYDSLLSQGVQPALTSERHDISLEKLVALSATLCDTILQPGLVLRNVGSNAIDSLRLWYRYDAETRDTLHWLTTLGPGEQDTFFLPPQNLKAGSHRLQIDIFSVNDSLDYHYLDNRLDQSFQISPGAGPSVRATEVVCQGSNAWLRSESGDTLLWYEEAFSQRALDTAAAWLSPPLSQSQTFYAASWQKGQAGKLDNAGDNGSYNEPSGGLWFDALRPFVIRSVLVYSVGDGIRTVELRDRNGDLRQSKNLFVNFGPRRLELDFVVPADDSLQLRVVRNSGLPQFYSSYDDLDFPYEQPGVLRIRGADLLQNGASIYPFLYDWELEYEGCRVAIPVEVQPGKHQSQFQIDPAMVDLQNGGKVQFTAQSEDAVSWFWDFGDGDTSSLPNPTHIYDSAAVYEVGLTSRDSSACSDTEVKNLSVVGWNVGIAPEEKSLWVSLYPNPGKGFYQLEIQQLVPTEIEWSLLDLQGRLYQRGRLGPGQQKRAELDLSSLGKGVYLLVVQSGDQRKVIKVVKH